MREPFDGLSLAEMVAWIQANLQIRCGTPASADEIVAVEREYAVTLPADYRELLTRWGSLEVIKDGRTQLRVYGVESLAQGRDRFRSHFTDWGFDLSWPEGDGESMAMLQPAYEGWLPVMIGHEESDHRATVCLAPDGTAYTVSVKEWDIEEPPWDSLTAAFAGWLGGVTYTLHRTGVIPT